MNRNDIQEMLLLSKMLEKGETTKIDMYLLQKEIEELRAGCKMQDICNKVLRETSLK